MARPPKARTEIEQKVLDAAKRAEAVPLEVDELEDLEVPPEQESATPVEAPRVIQRCVAPVRVPKGTYEVTVYALRDDGTYVVESKSSEKTVDLAIAEANRQIGRITLAERDGRPWAA